MIRLQRHDEASRAQLALDEGFDRNGDAHVEKRRLMGEYEAIFGCANQAGEDSRNVARMSLLLAGAAGQRAGHDHQQAVRLRDGCG